MALTFEKEINLTTYTDNPSPKVVNQLSIAHEARNGDITQYYIVHNTNQAGDKESNAIGLYHAGENIGDPGYYTYTDYDELVWSSKSSSRITRQKIDRLGIKVFPNIGGIAHYKLAYRNLSRLLVPINYVQHKYQAPTLQATVYDTYIHFVITPPDQTNTPESELITYNAYRICMQWNEFTLEYVTYETEYDAPIPETTGTYACWCIGYVHEGEAWSNDSNILALNIQGIRPDWPDVTPGSEDIYINQLHFTDDGKIVGSLTNGAEVTSDNEAPDISIESLHFNSDGKLVAVLTNGNEIISDNASPGGGGGGDDVNVSIASIGRSNALVNMSGQIIKMSSYTDDYIVPKDILGNTICPDFSQPFEIGCRFKIKVPAGSIGRNVFGSRDSYYQCPAIAVAPNNANMYYYLSTDGGSWQYRDLPIFTDYDGVPCDKWIFVKIIYDGTKTTYYVNDGTNQATVDVNAAPYSPSSLPVISFGAQNKSYYSISALANSEIDLNHTYIKQNGQLIWGYDDSSHDTPEAITLYSWDFTKSLTDKIKGKAITLPTGITRTDEGIILNGTNEFTLLSTGEVSDLSLYNKTIEVEFGNFELATSAYCGIVFVNNDSGFIYTNDNRNWSTYFGRWTANISDLDRNTFANSKLGIYIDNLGRWHFYKDGVSISNTTPSGTSISLPFLQIGDSRTVGMCNGTEVKKINISRGNIYA